MYTKSNISRLSILFILLIVGTANAKSSKVIISESICTNAQVDVNHISEIIQKYPAGKRIDSREAFSEIWKKFGKFIQSLKEGQDGSEENLNGVQVIFGIGDWSETVQNFNTARDYGSMQETKKVYSHLVRDYQIKQNFINNFCPDIEFPGFDYWYAVIKK